MDRVVKVGTTGDGPERIGIPISEGPGTLRLVLTWPYRDGGRIVEIPVEDIEYVEETIQGPLEETPEAADLVEPRNPERVPTEKSA